MGERTTPIEALLTEGAERRPPRGRRRWATASWVVGGLIVLLGIAAVLVDNGLRAAAESVAAGQIEQRLPAGVTGHLEVRIEGGSVILQYLSGSFDRVDVDGSALKIDGQPAPTHVVARGVPTDLTKPVRDVTARVALDQAALNSLVKVPGAVSGVTPGDGTLSFDGSQSLLGLTVSYRATAKAKAAGETITLTPTAATVTASPVGLNFTAVVNAILGQAPLSVCVAQYLPAGVEITNIAVTPTAATLSFAAKNLVLSGSALATKGSCG